MVRSATWFAAGLLLALAASVAEAQSDEPRQWLERMSDALATRNYDGLFTHSTAGQVESMRIVHRVAKGQSLERLVSLDGSGREVVRTEQESDRGDRVASTSELAPSSEGRIAEQVTECNDRDE